MGRSFANINIHIIFHVKSGGCEILEEDLPKIFQYIGGMIRVLDGYAFMVGGRTDHIHILASLPVSVSISDFVGKLKSNTSRWIKSLGSRYRAFAWQEGYGAFSVSESHRAKVTKYIINQKEHHQNRSAQEEYLHFIEKHRSLPNTEARIPSDNQP